MTGKKNCLRLKRPCTLCGKTFQPLGRMEKLCSKCFDIRRSSTLRRKMQK